MTTEEALRILDLAPPVSEATVKAAYRGLAKRFHPDRYASYDRKIWAGEKFLRVKEAYDLLRQQGVPTFKSAPSPQKATQPPEEPGGRRTTVFDNYEDQSDFTQRDFIAWLSLWRFGCALCRMAARPLAGSAVADSMGFQLALVMVMLPPALIALLVVPMLALCFGLYVLLQKTVITALETAFRMKIGPDSRTLAGHLAYLGILATGAALALGFARYVMSFEKNHDWVTTILVWTFASTLALTCVLEVVLFLKARLLTAKLGRHLESAMALPE